MIPNTTKKKIIAIILVTLLIVNPLMFLKTVLYLNVFYVVLSAIILLLIILLEKIESWKGNQQDPKNGLFSAIFKILFLFGFYAQYIFLHWLFSNNSEHSLKNDALKQFAKHQGIIEKIADKLTQSN